jgi:hypothetical protein
VPWTRDRKSMIERWLEAGGGAVELDEGRQVPQHRKPAIVVISFDKGSAASEIASTIEQYPSEDVSTRESPAGDLGKARHIRSTFSVHHADYLPSYIRKCRIMEALEDGNRSSLLGVIEQDGVLRCNRVHQPPVRQRKHACGRRRGMLCRDRRGRRVLDT